MTWADFIANDLTAKVRSGKLLSIKLTLQSLCDEYRVSMTPVQRAVKKMVKEGILLKDENKKLRPNLNMIGESKLNSKSKSTFKPPIDLFDKVARDLVLQSLDCKPCFLREDTAAKHYDVSRTIIRRIFHHLAGAGIIDHIPRRGWQLRPFSKDDLKAFLQIREILELKALELAREHLEPIVLKKILAGNSADSNKADNSIHNYIIEKSGNRYIKDFFEHYGKYYEILFLCEDMDKPSAALAAWQHRNIIKSLLSRNWRQAKNYLSQHIHINHTILNTKPGIIVKLAQGGEI